MEAENLKQELVQLIIANEGKAVVKIPLTSLKHYTKEEALNVLGSLIREPITIEKSDSMFICNVLRYGEIGKKYLTLGFDPKVPEILRSVQ